MFDPSGPLAIDYCECAMVPSPITPADQSGIGPGVDGGEAVPADQTSRIGRFADDHSRVSDALGALLAMVIAVSGALATMRVWTGDLSKPIGYSGDALLNLMAIRSIIDGGWYLHIDRLGAPFGLDMADYAVGADNASFLEIKFMSLLTSWPPYILFGFFVASFALVALSSFAVLRALRVGRWSAIVGAALFALIPFHFIRGTAHLFLANYWVVPLGAYLFVQVCRGESLFRRRDFGSKFNPLAWATGRTVVTLGICALVASDGIYYAAFTIMLLVVAGAASVVSTKRYAGAATAAVLAAVIGAVVVVNLAPSISYRSSHGTNSEVGQRLPVESEVYSLRFAQLVLPQPNHRVPAAAALYPEWAGVTATNGEGSQSPGTIGAIGLVFLLFVIGGRVIGRQRPGALSDDSRLTAFALGVAASILFAASGGVAVLFAFYISPQLRASNRISVFVAFFAISAIVLAIDHWRPSRRAARSRKAVFGGLLVAVLLFGWWDQTSPTYVPAYSQAKAAWDSDENYGRSVEGALGGTGEVLQLPYHPFPESVPSGKMMDYDQLRGYLHTNKIGWSYGAMKGRPEDWQEELSQLTVAQQVDRAIEAGFDGIEIDRFGYPDDARAVEGEIASRLGTDPIVSADQRLAFYDAGAVARSLREKRGAASRSYETLHPIQLKWGLGFTGAEPDGSRWADSTSELYISNPTPVFRRSEFRTVLSTIEPSTTTISLLSTLPAIRTVATIPSGTELVLAMWVPPGGTRVRFVSDAARKPAPPSDPRPMVLYFSSPKLVKTRPLKRNPNPR